MCGIAGYVGKGDRETVERMASRLVHRGPDDGGVWADSGVGLGFRRLSVIDVADGRQPMTNADGTVRLVFNGEIYNFQELRAELEGKYRFTTRSDTEVVLHLYEEMRERMFERLWGMFAIAVWDARKGRLVLGRDRLGKKPVYVMRHQGGIVFASEMKAVTEHPAFRRDLDAGALAHYFEREYLPPDRTAFAGVEKLLPGHYGVWKDGAWTVERYWSLPADPSRTPVPESRALPHLHGLLLDATRRRLVADVPVGVFLSGGVDSSLVAALAAEVSGEPVKTFSIGFTDASYDESPYAREVAGLLGTRHSERVFGESEALAALEASTAALDEPFADASFLPTYMLSKMTREQMTVALSGDGGDEVFWGYGTFAAHRVADLIARLPKAVTSGLLPALVSRLPASDRYMSFPFVAERFVRGLGSSPLERDRAWRSAVPASAMERLFAPDLLEAAGRSPAGASWWESAFKDPRVRMQASYLLEWLPEDILYKTDRASMAASLEVRSPLLDHRVVEFGWDLPDRLKLSGLTGKRILKDLLERYLPKRLVRRRKQGFSPPIAAWLRGPLKAECETYFSEDYQRALGLFRPETVARWWREHLERKKDHRRCLWALLMFCRWHERWAR